MGLCLCICLKKVRLFVHSILFLVKYGFILSAGLTQHVHGIGKNAGKNVFVCLTGLLLSFIGSMPRHGSIPNLHHYSGR